MTAAVRLCPRCQSPLTKQRIAKKKRLCYKCEVAAKQARKVAAHNRTVAARGLTVEEYWRLYKAQGGRCAIYGCRATGKTKHLAIEHDHKCDRGHDPKIACRECVRGLTCSMHNGWLGKSRDDPLVFDSLAAYLRDPPARKVLNNE